MTCQEAEIIKIYGKKTHAPTHTDTHTHKCTHTCTYTHAYTCTHTCMHKHRCPCHPTVMLENRVESLSSATQIWKTTGKKSHLCSGICSDSQCFLCPEASPHHHLVTHSPLSTLTLPHSAMGTDPAFPDPVTASEPSAVCRHIFPDLKSHWEMSSAQSRFSVGL